MYTSSYLLQLIVIYYRRGEGNGTPLQYSYLENPMDGGAWQAAVHGVAKSQTQLSDFTFIFTFMHWRRKWQPTPVFLPGESQERGSLMGCRLWGHTEQDTTEVTQQQQLFITAQTHTYVCVCVCVCVYIYICSDIYCCVIQNCKVWKTT